MKRKDEGGRMKGEAARPKVGMVRVSACGSTVELKPLRPTRLAEGVEPLDVLERHARKILEGLTGLVGEEVEHPCWLPGYQKIKLPNGLDVWESKSDGQTYRMNGRPYKYGGQNRDAEVGEAGVNACHSTGVNACRSTGVNACRRTGGAE